MVCFFGYTSCLPHIYPPFISVRLQQVIETFGVCHFVCSGFGLETSTGHKCSRGEGALFGKGLPYSVAHGHWIFTSSHSKCYSWWTQVGAKYLFVCNN